MFQTRGIRPSLIHFQRTKKIIIIIRFPKIMHSFLTRGIRLHLIQVSVDSSKPKQDKF